MFIRTINWPLSSARRIQSTSSLPPYLCEMNFHSSLHLRLGLVIGVCFGFSNQNLLCMSHLPPCVLHAQPFILLDLSILIFCEEYKYDSVTWVPCHRGMVRPETADGEGLQIWRVAANILNKQSQTANKM
jgi:hypothetical protein